MKTTTTEEQMQKLKLVAKESYEFFKKHEPDTPEGQLASKIVSTLSECGCFIIPENIEQELNSIGIFPL